MKYLKIIIALILFVSCKTETKKEFFEIKVIEKTVVEISPDTIQIKEMIKEMGDENFSTVVDDVIWYNSQMLEVLDSLDIKHVFTDKRFVRIITPNDRIEINNDTSKTKWRYFYYNGNETLEKDVFALIEMN